MAACQYCGDEIPDDQEYCLGCADYIKQSYEQMERDEQAREEYRQEIIRDFRGW